MVSTFSRVSHCIAGFWFIVMLVYLYFPREGDRIEYKRQKVEQKRNYTIPLTKKLTPSLWLPWNMFEMCENLVRSPACGQ